MALPEANHSAVLSECGTYRYELRRRWDPAGPVCAWVMLNPSTADAHRDDPTIRRCVGLSRSWGDAAIIVVNLYALRATHPRNLSSHPDPVGEDNDTWITLAASAAHRVVCAWGGHELANHRASQVTEILVRTSIPTRHALSCLGLTTRGAPRHPLFVPTASTPRPFPAQEVA